jgi:hypothetical protein
MSKTGNLLPRNDLAWREKLERPGAVLFLVLFTGFLTSPLSALVISEIHYNPFGIDDVLEFIEITNDAGTPEDLSGYAFVEGVFFTFPRGTILHGDSVIVVCANVDAVHAVYNIDNAIGNFSGQLDNGGESITLVNHVGVVVEEVSYRDEGKWPVGSDGTGHTLVIRNRYHDSNEPESWTQSPELGGSPGQPNFTEDGQPDSNETAIVDIGDNWRYRKGTQPFSDPPTAWRDDDIDGGFDDSDWLVGPSGFGMGDDDDTTLLDDMEDNYTALAIRTTFTLTADQLDGLGTFFFEINFDDGFCAFLNGTELASANCPEEIVWNEVATRPREATEELFFSINSGLLREGDNLLAIIGFNRAIGSNDFTLLPRLVERRPIDEGETSRSDLRVVFNELSRASGGEDGWVELYNGRSISLDLSGFRVTDGSASEFVLPPDSSIARHGFLVLSESDTSLNLSTDQVRLFLFDPDDFVVAAEVFDQQPPVELGVTEFAEARFPDGGRAGWITEVLTRGTENVVPRITDVVINEIYYHPPEERAGEFLEFYNRGNEAVDMSGFQLTKGIGFTFPSGTMLASGNYLVLAQEPEVLDEHYNIEDGFAGALGPYEGELANGGENVRLVDQLGNLVDEVRYYDGGRWSGWADGGGASLELIDPAQDNDIAAAWGASDESDKSEWEELSFVVPEYAPGKVSELHLLLPQRGVCHIDDVSITAPGFETRAIVDEGDNWKFMKGTRAFSTPALAWVEDNFDDGGWLEGPSGFGISDDDDNTVLDDMQFNYTSVAIRKTFEIAQEDLDAPGQVLFGIDYDDGFCAFLNGVELAREGCPENVTWDATATSSNEAGEEEFFPIPTERLRVGQNLLAIVGYNRAVNGLDFSLIPRVVQRVRAGRSDNHIPNPDFEVNTQPWRIEGTHGHSQRITTDSHSGNACLELIATAKGDDRCNRIETDTSPNLTELQYDVSLWARWLRGSSLIIVHGAFAPGPFNPIWEVNLSSNSLSERLRLTVPWNLGTPGAENSQRARLRQTTGSDNLGPVIADVRHRPFSPVEGELTRLSARVSDSDDVASVQVFFKENRAAQFGSRELFDDGSHGDGDDGDGVYGGELPGFALNTKVTFFIEAVDTLGVTGRFPVEAPGKTCVFMVEGPVAERIQIVLDDEATAELNSRHLHSNDLVDGTFIFQDDDAYYNIGMRYRGSPWGRPSRQSIRIAFSKDQRFHRGYKDINISNRDRNDGVGQFLARRNSTPEATVPAAEYHYVRTRFNGDSWGAPGVFQTYDRDLIEQWYGPESAKGGVCLKGDGRKRFNDQCTLDGWDEATLIHIGERTEDYRFYWRHAMHQTRDNWQPFMTLTEVVDPRISSDEEFEEQLDTILDVEQFLRVLGTRIMVADVDGLFITNGHNGYMYWDPIDGRFSYLPFDMGLTFGSTTPNLFAVRDARVRRILDHPESQRTYFRVIDEYINGYGSEEIAGPYLDALQSSPASLGAGMKNNLRASSSFIRGQLSGVTEVAFRILTNGGNNFVTPTTNVALEGEASVRVASLLLSINGAEPRAIEAKWSGATRKPIKWEASLGLLSGNNDLEIFGITGDNSVLDTASISITSSAGPPAPFIRGDCDQSGVFDFTDALVHLEFLFLGLHEEVVTCLDACDSDDSGEADFTDAIHSLKVLFLGQGVILAPGSTVCGLDPTEGGNDVVGCTFHGACP